MELHSNTTYRPNLVDCLETILATKLECYSQSSQKMAQHGIMYIPFLVWIVFSHVLSQFVCAEIILEHTLFVNNDSDSFQSRNGDLVATTDEALVSGSSMSRIQPNLPSFDRGGLIFFLHIPKTGGTTIRQNIESLDRIEYVFGRNHSVHLREGAKVEHAIQHGTKNNSILFYEIHAKDSPSFFQLRQRLQRWRETAQRNHVPTFFFSLVRDPLAFSFSHFSFFHVQERNPTFERCNATEENFLRLSLWNPQCQFLFKGESSMRAQQRKQIVIQPEECNDVQEQMWSLFDWVGTTERLSNETLPLLLRLLSLPTDFKFQTYKVSKESGETFGWENVTLSTIHAILERSALDTSLYQNVQRRYHFSKMKALQSDSACTKASCCMGVL